ncbi:metal-dependent hydrolase [Rhodobacteraceae bacterium RKSG542]|uniref:metal-dependent hydrolase n=1 Tax=Pseudovibrio flavus TaxID=2529854 RepID=UPI0012BBFF60|nr:metal-dependent hydrolase [Pseudovibrio flavus]MTI16365.1 metal-dependent hydrolase [Pseudovibrio flavus]
MKITFWGHAAATVEINGAKILIDPFLSQNPAFPSERTIEEVSEGVTHVVITHGHDDHIGDAIEILQQTGALLTSNFEICMWAQSQGITNINPMNAGGCVDLGPFKVALTNAIHSSSSQLGDGTALYLGNPNGVVIMAEGEPTLYHMGDTDIFGDMALINELYEPKVGLVPIGDRFTMGAKSAAIACKRYFNFQAVIPCHYASFEVLDQSADSFIEQMGDKAHTVAPIASGEQIEVRSA